MRRVGNDYVDAGLEDGLGIGLTWLSSATPVIVVTTEGTPCHSFA